MDPQEQEERRVTAEYRAIRDFQEPLDQRVSKDRPENRVAMDRKDLQVLLVQWETEASKELRETLVRRERWVLQVLQEPKENWVPLVQSEPEETTAFKAILVPQGTWAPWGLQVIQAKMDFPDSQAKEEKWECLELLVNQVLSGSLAIRDQLDQQELPEIEEYPDFWVHPGNEVHPVRLATMALQALQDRKDRLVRLDRLDLEAFPVKEVSSGHRAQRVQEATQETWDLQDNRDRKVV